MPRESRGERERQQEQQQHLMRCGTFHEARRGVEPSRHFLRLLGSFCVASKSQGSTAHRAAVSCL